MPTSSEPVPCEESVVWIVLVNFNSSQYLKLCVETLSRLTHTRYSVVVVDNRSTDHSVSELRELAARHRLTLICSPENAGFAAGANLGIHHAYLHGASYVWVLHPDTLVAPDALTVLLEQAKLEKGDFLLGSRVYALPGEIKSFQTQEENFAKGEIEFGTISSIGGWISSEANSVGFYGKGEADAEQNEGTRECDFLPGCSLFFSAVS